MLQPGAARSQGRKAQGVLVPSLSHSSFSPRVLPKALPALLQQCCSLQACSTSSPMLAVSAATVTLHRNMALFQPCLQRALHHLKQSEGCVHFHVQTELTLANCFPAAGTSAALVCGCCQAMNHSTPQAAYQCSLAPIATGHILLSTLQCWQPAVPWVVLAISCAWAVRPQSGRGVGGAEVWLQDSTHGDAKELAFLHPIPQVSSVPRRFGCEQGSNTGTEGSPAPQWVYPLVQCISGVLCSPDLHTGIAGCSEQNGR